MIEAAEDSSVGYVRRGWRIEMEDFAHKMSDAILNCNWPTGDWVTYGRQSADSCRSTSLSAALSFEFSQQLLNTIFFFQGGDTILHIVGQELDFGFA